jgi:hypothetical protein
MLRLIAVVLTALLPVAPAATAAEMPDRNAHQQAMQKLGFLVGEWEGSGSIAMGPGPRQTFVQHERIQFKHDGTLLLIEGNGKSPAGATVHDALAVVQFDPRSAGYKFRSFVAVGRYGEAEASVNGNTFVWTMKAGPQQTMRYTITIDGGVWREIGERSADGAAWTPFFEMTLKKK